MNDIERRARNFEPISIVECERLAQDVGYDSTEFYLVGPFGIKQAKWLDAYFGFLTFDGLGDGKMASTQSIAELPNIVCLNVQWPGMGKDAAQ